MTASAAEPVIITANWADYQAQLAQVRTAVFVNEQGVPADIEMDAEDAQCHHLLALVDNQPVGTARLLADGRIGRLAVLKTFRGQGIGQQLLKAAVALADSVAMKSLYLHAQVQTLGFYQAEGFVADGEVFTEAGIRHQNMVLSLA
ncbi:MAG: GNAT family N-acetyltransferase [Gammaproteobacteria bacterium]|nr:MAG: GNAT family N-acetyltransferase [Gammaproteobacteria bacterium]RLA15813.1 MAG: GNAT family N-acetyltransferase [Gammaproteobacteria bacterium]